MNRLLATAIIFLLFGCSSTDNKNEGDKHEIKSHRVEAKRTSKKMEKFTVPTPSSAVVKSLGIRHIFDQTTVASTLEKIFDDRGKVVYKRPPITWNGAKQAVSLPGGTYMISIGCWANGGHAYNYHKMKVNLENEKDYTFFCLEETGKSFLGIVGVVALYGFYSETSQLEVSQKTYQSEIDKVSKK